MSDRMPAEICEALIMLADREAHREICGFIMKDWVIFPIDNVSSRDDHFDMDEQQQLHVMMEHRGDIVGLYHSHPSGSFDPSMRDCAMAPIGMRYWIITLDGVAEWEIKNGDATLVADSVYYSSKEVRPAVDNIIDECIV